MPQNLSTSVIIPVKGDITSLAACLKSLVGVLTEESYIIVVDDGSTLPVEEEPELESIRHDPRITFLRHNVNKGPGAARNTGILHVRELNADIAIFLDADCRVEAGFILAHCQLHKDHPDTACFGGAIQGEGTGIWARIDGLMSWFTSLPGSPPHVVRTPYHLPTTNMSIKLSLFKTEQLFDEILKTGEDVSFNINSRKKGLIFFFIPFPIIYHKDRQTFTEFFAHQYRWGMHFFAARFGDRSTNFLSRGLLTLCVFFAAPAYILVATVLNLIPLVRISPVNFIWFPVLAFFYAIKSLAVMHGKIAYKKRKITKNSS